MNYSVRIQKLDPYLNVDPGTMSPYQHGEVFVTEDGAETDLDLGHYERFSESFLDKSANATSGKIYYSVINKEREGDYLGKTVQVIPHITDEIKKFITTNDEDNDIVITEVGGTVGDIESYQFLEAIRQLTLELGKNNCLSILLTYVPFIISAGELKTKPTQHAAIKLREIGIQPDILLCRSEKAFDEGIREKIALFTNVPKNSVINAIDVDSIYKVPFSFIKQNLQNIICNNLNMEDRPMDLTTWQKFIDFIDNPEDRIKVAICGKYVVHQDAYKSIVEAFVHAGVKNRLKVEIVWVDTEKINTQIKIEEILSKVNGILIPGGFDYRGAQGKIFSARYARENKIPFFGICLGMHIAVIEFAQNVCNLDGASSTEFDKQSRHPVIHIMKEQEYIQKYGATMRLGSYPCLLSEGSFIKDIYQNHLIKERHRHRYEFNNSYRNILQKKGFFVCGTSPDDMLVETVELTCHPFFIGVQYHPEFKSNPTNPHPLFTKFVECSYNNKIKNMKK